MEAENRLLPILRQGVEVVKMIFFRRLQVRLANQYPAAAAGVVSKLAGAVINEVFGTPNHQEPFASFARAERDRIREILDGLAADLAEMKGPLTDALRISFLCDHQEGHGDPEILKRADQLGILVVDRDIPLPAKFLTLVRQLGEAYGLILAPVAEPTATPATSTRLN